MKKMLQSLAAAVLLSAPLASQAELTICYDLAAGGFTYNAAQCVSDGGPGDGSPSADSVVAVFNLPGVTITSSIGEPAFGPGFGLSLSVDGTLTSSYIFAVVQTDLNYGAPGATVTANFTGSSNPEGGTLAYEVRLDDLNRNLTGGIVGTVVSASGGPGSSQIAFTDPFSLFGIITLTPSAGGNFFSTDLTVQLVPEPGVLALLGVGLTGVALLRRRRR